MVHLLTFLESVQFLESVGPTPPSQISQDEFLRRLRWTSANGYAGSVHPSIVRIVMNWRSIFKSPKSNSLYSVMHDPQMLGNKGWSHKTYRMSDHWNNSYEMSAKGFLQRLYNLNDSIPSHFYISMDSNPGQEYKVDLALQKYLLAPDEDEETLTTIYKDNQTKLDIVMDEAKTDREFTAAFIWHNYREDMCCLAIVDRGGAEPQVNTHHIRLSAVKVIQYTLWTNKPVESGTHWTVARYNKESNIWVVQDTKPKADYSDQLPWPGKTLNLKPKSP